MFILTIFYQIQCFLKNINPIGDISEKEFEDYLYNKSREIEPKDSSRPSKGVSETLNVQVQVVDWFVL